MFVNDFEEFKDSYNEYYTKTINFYELRDGWSTKPRFYEMEAHVGFSWIVKVSYEVQFT